MSSLPAGSPPLRIRTTRPVLPIETTTITTPRLILRPLHASDLAAYHKIRTSPAVMKHSQLHKPDPDLAFSKTKLDPSLSPQSRAAGTETYLLGVEERSNPGILIGDMGCHDASPGKEELGYMFLEQFWGKGYATEALQAYLDHYWSLARLEYEVDDDGSIDGREEGSERQQQRSREEVLRLEVVRAIAEAENDGSIKVLRKCGFKETRRFLHENGAWRVELEIERPTATLVE